MVGGMIPYPSDLTAAQWALIDRCMRSDWKSGANTQPSPFAGKELNWLYAAEEGRLFRRPVKVRAVDAPVKPQTIVVREIRR
jgi:hypothetical protein